MQVDQRERLRAIRTLPQLIAYLRDEIGWPIAQDSFDDADDLFYDFSPKELGIDPAHAAKIESIRRLRPLSARQPWSIFFVKFEPKRLPVVALRRILGGVALKKRASANPADRQAWAMEDLLFISNYGEGDERQIAFAHFSQPDDGRDLPTLRVLGWDNLDTPLHLDAVARDLTTNLAWPDDQSDLKAWRERWGSAFTLRHREVITTSRALSERLAELAGTIRDRIKTALAIETPGGPLRNLLKTFQQSLVHDLDGDGFADMYAQTIAYGLFSARIADPAKRTTDDFAAHMRTNPFLRELMEAFLQVGGRHDRAGDLGIDFDELGVGDVVQLLDDADMAAVVRDFGDRNPLEDPVIHFYEHFLEAYDKRQKVNRGVFYTPRPVVTYIVRSVDAALRRDFGIIDGLADTTTWGEVAERLPHLPVPAGTSASSPFVRILDPATGTGTFLVEVIDLIHQTMTAKWKSQGHTPADVTRLWNEYVPAHLLPRLHGFELLMAPYAIAHLKVGLKLFETGYRFGSDERARIYLTNSLEPPQDLQGQFEFAVLALAGEARAVNKVKQSERFTVVIGNPPYSNFGRLNRVPFILTLLEDYKEGLTDKKINIDDDFIKFVRFGQYLIERSGGGILAFITSNAYLDGLTHRRMRQCLLSVFSAIRIVNLHGSSRKKERAPDGSADENLFEITVGVAVALFVRASKEAAVRIQYADLWGERATKSRLLLGGIPADAWAEMEPSPDYYFFARKDFAAEREYLAGWSLRDMFEVWQNGIKTDRDELFYDFDKSALEQRMQVFFGSELSQEFRDRYQVVASSSYDIESRRRAAVYNPGNLQRCLYRPFDVRWLYYDPAVTSRPANRVMRHMLAGPNFGMIATRQTRDRWGVLITDLPCGHKSLAAYDINTLFPLTRYDDPGELTLSTRMAEPVSRSNLRAEFLEAIWQAVDTVPPEHVFDYAYAVFHSPSFVQRYRDFLLVDFPRLPLPTSREFFSAMARLGARLSRLHRLVEASGAHEAEYVGPRDVVLSHVRWSDDTVWIASPDRQASGRSPGARAGFTGVSREVFNHEVGGYRVAEKWLSDRKGRTLSSDDIALYQKTVAALAETIHLMGEIDEVIEAHGGWPGAFVSDRPRRV